MLILLYTEPMRLVVEV